MSTWEVEVSVSSWPAVSSAVTVTVSLRLASLSEMSTTWATGERTSIAWWTGWKPLASTCSS